MEQYADIQKILADVGKHYKEAGTVLEYDPNHRQDGTHTGIYQLAHNPRRAIELKVFGSASTDEQLQVHARLVRYVAYMNAREKSGIAPNYNRAIIRPLPEFSGGIAVPKSAEALEKLLEKDCPELKPKA